VCEGVGGGGRGGRGDERITANGGAVKDKQVADALGEGKSAGKDGRDV